MHCTKALLQWWRCESKALQIFPYRRFDRHQTPALMQLWAAEVAPGELSIKILIVLNKQRTMRAHFFFRV